MGINITEMVRIAREGIPPKDTTAHRRFTQAHEDLLAHNKSAAADAAYFFRAIDGGMPQNRPASRAALQALALEAERIEGTLSRMSMAHLDAIADQAAAFEEEALTVPNRAPEKPQKMAPVPAEAAVVGKQAP